MNYCKRLPLLFLCYSLNWEGGLSLAQMTLPSQFGSDGDSMNYNGQTTWMTLSEMKARAEFLKFKNEQLERQNKIDMLTAIIKFKEMMYEDIKKQMQINDNLQQEINKLRMVLEEESNYGKSDLCTSYNTSEKDLKDEAAPNLQLPDELKSHSEIIWVAIQKAKKEIDHLIKKGNLEAAKIVLYDEEELSSFPERMQKKAYLYIDSEVEAYKDTVLSEK
jgi:hypothetical protein